MRRIHLAPDDIDRESCICISCGMTLLRYKALPAMPTDAPLLYRNGNKAMWEADPQNCSKVPAPTKMVPTFKESL